ncbi:MAG: hypothetical protein GY851_01750 [bacterium]|nr:hypothetical protein [bacterium]
MHVRTFVGKVSVEALRQMDDQINKWLDAEKAEARHISQTFGYELHREAANNEPVIVTSIWY